MHDRCASFCRCDCVAQFIDGHQWLCSLDRQENRKRHVNVNRKHCWTQTGSVGLSTWRNRAQNGTPTRMNRGTRKHKPRSCYQGGVKGGKNMESDFNEYRNVSASAKQQHEQEQISSQITFSQAFPCARFIYNTSDYQFLLSCSSQWCKNGTFWCVP